jgi:hypothetical protein
VRKTHPTSQLFRTEQSGAGAPVDIFLPLDSGKMMLNK